VDLSETFSQLSHYCVYIYIYYIYCINVCVCVRVSEVESPIISMAVCLAWSGAKRPFSCQNKAGGSELQVTSAFPIGL